MESESDKKANAVRKLSLGDVLNWKQTEMETCVQVVYWGRISKGVKQDSRGQSGNDPIGALELGWTFRVVSK